MQLVHAQGALRLLSAKQPVTGAWRFVALLCLLGLGCSGTNPPAQPPPSPEPLQLELVPVSSGFTNPLDLQQPADGSGRRFVAEQGGKIKIIDANGNVLSTPFLDITGKVESGGEEGLLGLVFHPRYAQNRRFFVNYTRNVAGQIQTVIAEYLASVTNPNQADPNSERILLLVDQPFANHNGGGLAFGPDGFLYIALGDGGGGGDPFANGQNTDVLLGKLLRIDVDSTPAPGLNYAIPPDNPFVNQTGRDEIWAYGLRNPFRFSFDRQNGRLFAGDVGQNRFEEVDLVSKGANLGWNIMEGFACFSPPSNCNQAGLTLPIFAYDRSQGDVVITGGYVYRGTRIPQLVSTYVFGDFASGRIWGLAQDAQGNWVRTTLLQPGFNISSFGQDQTGELYVVNYSGGSVLRLRQVGTP